MKLFELCTERHIAEFDFTIGDEAYKLRWSQYRLNIFSLALTSTIWGNCYKRISVLVRRAVNAGVKSGHGAAQKSTTPAFGVWCREEGQRPVSRAHRRLAGDWPLWPVRANPGGCGLLGLR